MRSFMARLSKYFSDKPSQLERGRQPVAEFHDAVIQEREAPLDGIGHGYSVTLRGEQVLRGRKIDASTC